jgi:hypothetical protein
MMDQSMAINGGKVLNQPFVSHLWFGTDPATCPVGGSQTGRLGSPSRGSSPASRPSTPQVRVHPQVHRRSLKGERPCHVQRNDVSRDTPCNCIHPDFRGDGIPCGVVLLASSASRSASPFAVSQRFAVPKNVHNPALPRPARTGAEGAGGSPWAGYRNSKLLRRPGPGRVSCP